VRSACTERFANRPLLLLRVQPDFQRSAPQTRDLAKANSKPASKAVRTKTAQNAALIQKFREPERTFQMEAIGTSVGFTHYRVLLPTTPCLRTLVLKGTSSTLANLGPFSKRIILFLHNGWLFFGLGPRPRLLSVDCSIRIASREWDCN
jgi:hypothetical protein